MKNKMVVIAALVCSIVLASCGGNSGGVKKNEYFGSLPSIYADSKADKEANKTKIKSLQEDVKDGKNFEKAIKTIMELKEKKKEIEEKMHTNASAEIQKIVGKEIPVSYSKSLQKSDELFYDVSAKLEANKKNYILNIGFAFTAKSSFDIPARKVGETGKLYWAYYRLVAADGSTITLGFCADLVKQGLQPSSVSAGAAFAEKPYSDDLTYMIHEPEKYAAFTGLEFITKDEYDAIRKQ